jgi:hypothetical protein
MTDETLSAWESYYVIVGSSAAALTGLQFVVMALIAEFQQEQQRNNSEAIEAFATPTVVHFCAALLISATLSAPWSHPAPVAIVLGIASFIGLGYVALVTRRARRQRNYKPVFEDWLFHSALPFVAYAATAGGAISLVSVYEIGGLFFIGGATLLLVFVGIHNAWDTVTFVAMTRLSPERMAEVSQAETVAPEAPPAAAETTATTPAA